METFYYIDDKVLSAQHSRWKIDNDYSIEEIRRRRSTMREAVEALITAPIKRLKAFVKKDGSANSVEVYLDYYRQVELLPLFIDYENLLSNWIERELELKLIISETATKRMHIEKMHEEMEKIKEAMKALDAELSICKLEGRLSTSECEISNLSRCVEMHEQKHNKQIAPLKKHRARLIQVKKIAQSIATEAWESEDCKHYRIAEMAKHIYHDSDFIDVIFNKGLKDNAPENHETIKVWIKEVSPPRASKRGRPKK